MRKRTSSALGLELLTTMDSPEITELAKDPTKIKLMQKKLWLILLTILELERIT